MTPTRHFVQRMRSLLQGLMGAVAGAWLALWIGGAGLIVGLLIGLFESVELVHEPLETTLRIIATMGAVGGILSAVPHSRRAGLVRALVLHAVAFGALAAADPGAPLMKVWLFAVGVAAGYASGVGGAAARLVSDSFTAAPAARS